MLDYNNLESVSINGIAPLRIMSFDIECAAHGGGFPDPKKDPVI